MSKIFQPSKSYLICTQARTGSSLLAQKLRLTRGAGKPSEHFHNHRLTELEAACSKAREKYGPEVHPLTDFFRENSSNDGIFGTKFMYAYIGNVRSVLGSDRIIDEWTDFDLLQYVFYEPSYIFLWRRDKLRQAISYYRANKSKVWARLSKNRDSNEKTPPVKFDYWEIRKALNVIRSEERAWRNFFRENEIEPLELVFEEFIQEPDEGVRRVLRLLEIPGADTVEIGVSYNEKQSDDLTEDWVERFSNLDRYLGKVGIMKDAADKFHAIAVTKFGKRSD